MDIIAEVEQVCTGPLIMAASMEQVAIRTHHYQHQLQLRLRCIGLMQGHTADNKRKRSTTLRLQIRLKSEWGLREEIHQDLSWINAVTILVSECYSAVNFFLLRIRMVAYQCVPITT